MTGPVSDYVTQLFSELHTGDLNTLEKLYYLDNHGQKMAVILDSWEKQQSEERRLRKFYATVLLVGVFSQMVFIDVLVCLLGRGVLVLEKWVVSSVIFTVFLEIMGLVAVVIQYLFPKKDGEFLRIIKDM